MVIRGYGRCGTCDQSYVLRAGIGIENYQRHYIDCSHCETPIVLAVNCQVPPPNYVVVENFTLTEDIDKNAVLINLHPSFAFDPDTYHSPKEFASLSYMGRISTAVEHLITDKRKFTDLARYFNIINAPHIWERVKRALILENSSSQKKNLEKTLAAYLAERKKHRPDVTITDTDSMLYDFLQGSFLPKIDKILNPAAKLLEKAKKDYPDEFENFKNYYKEHHLQQHKSQYISIFSDYFRNYTQYSQMLVHAKLGDTTPGPKVVGSKAFEEVKLYHGQAFEALTTSFVVLACLNNILAGRHYHQFLKMTLTKYKNDLEKSKKANPFNEVPEFSVFTQGLDSALRNGSHHASIWRQGDIVYYRSGGTGAERNMPFSDYLHSCNQITISLAALWLLERKLAK